MAPFDALMNDRVDLVRANGSRLNGLRSIVNPRSIMIQNGELVIENGDRIQRRLSGGAVESYLIIDKGYHSQFYRIPAFYRLRVRKEFPLIESSSSSSVHSLQGQYEQRSDNSVGELSSSSELNLVVFQEIKGAIYSSNLTPCTKSRLLDGVDGMQDALGRKTYFDKFVIFLGSAEDHMTILESFIPELADLNEYVIPATVSSNEASQLAHSRPWTGAKYYHHHPRLRWNANVTISTYHV